MRLASLAEISGVYFLFARHDITEEGGGTGQPDGPGRRVCLTLTFPRYLAIQGTSNKATPAVAGLLENDLSYSSLSAGQDAPPLFEQAN